jgi:hypothetical protein
MIGHFKIIWLGFKKINTISIKITHTCIAQMHVGYIENNIAKQTASKIAFPKVGILFLQTYLVEI